EFTQPRLTNLQSLIGAGSSDGPDRRSSYQTSELGEPSAQPVSRPQDGRVAILPWRGAFEWMGIVVAAATESLNSEMLARYVEPVAHLSDRLAVALELKRGREDLGLASERAMRTA